MLNERNQIHNFISNSGSGTVINYGSGSDFLASYGFGSTSQKVTVPTVPVPQRCLLWSFVHSVLSMPDPHNLVEHRETREGWPLLTPEANGNFWSTCTTYERGPSFVGSLGSSCRYKRFLSCLRCTSQPSTKYFFLTAHYFTSIVPSWACSRAASPVT